MSLQHRSATSASCALDEVLITDELHSRPARRNFAAENRALSALANSLAEPPEALLPALTTLALKLCHADTAGISLLDPGPPEVFRWTAVVGAAGGLHGSIPRHESPCGVVIERNDVLLFRGGERHFPRLRDSNPPIHECLLAPFDREGRPQGTVWAVKHHPDGRFHAEDARLLKSLSRFASAAYGVTEARARAERTRDTAAALHPRLLQVSKMALIGEIASGVANELSQPLTAIGNYAQACKRLVSRLPAGDPERLTEALEEIAGQSQRAAQTIEGLRRLVTVAGPERPETHLNAAVEEVLEVLQADARARRVHIDVRLADQLPPIRIERTQIQHVLLNLVRNALEVLEGGPADRREVVLETQSTAEGVELTISDNGPGLPEEARQRMFDPFFSTKSGGTGLGLPVSHSIVRAHGGRLIHERNPGGGARFRIRLPASGD